MFWHWGLKFEISHLNLQERSGVYERLVECEELAKQSKRGVHSAKEPPANRTNDVSQPGNAQKWVAQNKNPPMMCMWVVYANDVSQPGNAQKWVVQKLRKGFAMDC